MVNFFLPQPLGVRGKGRIRRRRVLAAVHRRSPSRCHDPYHADAQPVVGLVVLAGSCGRKPIVADVDFLPWLLSMMDERKKSSLNSTLLVQFSMVMQRAPTQRVCGDFPSAVHQHVLDEPIFEGNSAPQSPAPWASPCPRHPTPPRHPRRYRWSLPLVGNGERDVVAAWGGERVVQFTGAGLVLPSPNSHAHPVTPWFSSVSLTLSPTQIAWRSVRTARRTSCRALPHPWPPNWPGGNWFRWAVVESAAVRMRCFGLEQLWPQ